MNVDVAKNLQQVVGNLPEGVSLVAISKFHPKEYLEAAYAVGQRILARAMSKSLARRWPSCPRISSGISSVICRPIR